MIRLLYTLSFVFLSYIAWGQIDTVNGFTAPPKVANNARDLALHLCDEVISDTLKANLIFNWITHNIAYDIKTAKDPDRPPPVIQKILADKKTTCEGYALLYMEMCEAVGLEAVTIAGYVKDWKWDNGDKFYLPRHMWCAVMIDRRWELVDPTFGAGGIVRTPGWLRAQLNKFSKEEKIEFPKNEVFQFRYNTAYFIMPPIDCRYIYLPEDPLWQLAKVPMPLRVFEAGDSAIAAFNEENSERINRGTELEYISRLNEQQKIVEHADRAYKFNNRYDLVLAEKEQISASEAVAKYASRRNVPPRRRFEDAYRGMVLADGYLKKQRGAIPEQYNELKKKNSTKNKEANDHIRRIRTHNKTLAAQSRTHKMSAERKLAALVAKREKADEVLEKISPERIDSIKTTTVERGTASPAMLVLSDSMRAKKSRLKKLNFNVIEKMQAITLLQEDNNAKKEAWKGSVAWSDTLLVAETETRLGFRDNYDKEIILCMQLYDKARFREGDSLQKHYLQNFDTLILYYEQLLQLYLQQGGLNKSILRDMEQYRRWNSDESMTMAYTNACQGYTDCMSQYQQTMTVYENYMTDNAKMFEEMAKLYEDELALADRMAEAETARKEAEDVALNESKSFDERENDKNQLIVSGMLKELTDILSK